MSRFYFHLRDFTGGVFEDDEGSDLANLTEAKEQALRAMQELVSAAIRSGNEAEVEAIVIADERGTQLAAVPLVMALPPTVVGVLKHPEKIVPKNRLEEYRLNADQCRAKAESATETDDKTSWLKLADAWLQMLPLSEATAHAAGWPQPSEEHSKASH
jgi:hypothetical protein